MKSPEDVASGSSRLTFIEVSNPYEQSADQRALVRSRATRASHRDPNRKAKTSNKDRQSRRRLTFSVRKSAPGSGSNSPEERDGGLRIPHMAREPEPLGVELVLHAASECIDTSRRRWPC